MYLFIEVCMHGNIATYTVLQEAEAHVNGDDKLPARLS